MKKDENALIHLKVASVFWQRERGFRKCLLKAGEAALAALPLALQPLAGKASFTVLLTTDRRVQNLNRDYRGYDKPTNVLSFPSFGPDELEKAAKGEEGTCYVGDVAMAYAYCKKEARQQNKTFLDHAAHLMVHSTLHLFGFDHDTHSRAEQMEAMEVEVLRRMGIADPY